MSARLPEETQVPTPLEEIASLREAIERDLSGGGFDSQDRVREIERRLSEIRDASWSEWRSMLDRVEQRGSVLASEARELERFERVVGDASDALERNALRKIDRRAFDDASIYGGPTMKTATDPSFDTYLRSGVPSGELRALGVSTDTAGGYLVPEGFRTKLIERLQAFGGVRRVAESLTTTTGLDLSYPTEDDTANVGAIAAENTQIGEQDVVLGERTLRAHMYTSKIVRVSFQLVEDSAFDLEAHLANVLARRIGRAQNAHFTTGTGTSQPEGIQPSATVGKAGATGQTTTVTYDDLVDLLHSVDPAYREPGEPGVGWMMRDTTFAALRKLKDADNRPMIEPNVQGEAPNRLLGYPITINNDMPAMAASAKSILFGNFRAGYVVRDIAQGFGLLVLRERYADFLQLGYLGFARADGGVQDPEAYRAYQNAAS
jgi:HK97 family phage major capsid protein